MKDLLGYISVVITLTSYASYFYSIFRGHTKPHAFSWVVWGLLVSIAFSVQYTNGAGAGAWATGLVGLSCFAVAITALFRGEKDIHKSDWVAFAAALMIIPVWYLTSDPLIAIFLVIIIDAFGYYPTFRKTYYKPYEEAVTVYILGVLQVTCSLCAMKHYKLVNILYPMFIACINTSFVFMLFYRRKKMHLKA